MTPTERRQRILEVLCVRRHDTCDNLAHEFHVSNATIRRDTVCSCATTPLKLSAAAMAEASGSRIHIIPIAGPSTQSRSSCSLD